MINGAVRVVGGSAKAGHAHFQRLDFPPDFPRFLQFVQISPDFYNLSRFLQISPDFYNLSRSASSMGWTKVAVKATQSVPDLEV